MKHLINLAYAGILVIFLTACQSSDRDRTEVYWESGILKFEVDTDELGVWQGEANWYFEEGNLERCAHYVNGELDGPFLQYAFDVHKQEEGAYTQGLKTGPWTYYHFMPTATGAHIQRAGSYRIYTYGDVRVSDKEGLWAFYDQDGNKIRQGAYLEDIENGLWQEWWPNGQLKSEGSYAYCYLDYNPGAAPLLSSNKTGTWSYWTETGELERTETYD